MDNNNSFYELGTNAESYMIPRHEIITFIRSLNNIVLFKKINLSEAIEKKKV